MKEKRLLSGILALALCLAVCFAAGAEVKSHDTMANGKIKETAWTDENGNPAPGPDGYAYIRYTYKGQDTFEYYFNEEGDPYQTDGGYYGRRILRDGKKRPVEIEYLDEDGKRTDTAMGYAQVLTAYTSFGGIRQVSYYGVNKKPVIVPSLGYASMVIEYSGKTVASKTFRNAKGNPVDSVEGYAVMKQKIDKKKKNQVTSIRYDHADGTPATGPDGWFRCVKDRDDKGRLLSVKYYDVNSQMTDRGAGYAWEGYAYDGDSTVKVTRYDLNGQPVTDAAGVATTVREMKDDLVSQTGVCLANSSYLREWFALHQVPVFLETTLKEVKDGAIVCADKDGKTFEVACDSVIGCVGYKPAPLAEAGKNVSLVGDCLSVGNLRSVIWRAYEVAMKI